MKWVVIGVGAAVVAGGAYWWVHSNSKAAGVSTAQLPKQANSGTGAVATVGLITSDVNQASQAFVNVTNGIANISELASDGS